MFQIKSFGWRPDFPDFRDFRFKVPRHRGKLPAHVDLAPNFLSIWDQGDLGSCTGHATAAQVWYKDRTDAFEPSRLFIYYNTRVLENTVNFDSGASIRNSIKSVVQWGACPEKDHPYNIRNFKKKPTKATYKTAKGAQILQYARVPQTEKSLKASLAKDYPINFGFVVYSSFNNGHCTRTGIVPMPEGHREEMLGGHAVLLVGYDDKSRLFKFRNSYSTRWGDKGYGYLPYDYVLNRRLAMDFWAVYAVR